MRIRCQNLGDFFANVRAAEVLRGTVWFEKTERPLTDQPRHKATSLEVTVRVSAILLLDEVDSRLLEMAEICGVDRTTADGGPDGSDRADEVRKELEQHCEDLQLRILPGELDMS